MRAPLDRDEMFVDALIAKAKSDRLPELFAAPHPEALYVRRRAGIVVVALRQGHLDQTQLATIRRYRLANRLMYGEVDSALVGQHGVECEWWCPGGSDDVHILAASAESGELVGYLVLSFLGSANSEMTLRTEARPRFSAEDVFGWRVFHGVPGLADQPLTRVAELMRFMRTNWLGMLNPLAIRGPVEVGVALYYLMTGPLAADTFALVADVTEYKAQRNLDFFDFPTLALRDAQPIDNRLLSYPRCTEDAYPIVMLTSAFPKTAKRVATIEAALSLAGAEGMRTLIDLRKKNR
ncbi:MAG TPA: hypothetical protein VGG22_08535 [Candidatus Baltobacteraceae bacterium]